jgi:hypothetical protein
MATRLRPTSKLGRQVIYKPLLMAKSGSGPVMGEVAPLHQVAAYLYRLRASLPFPCSLESAYYGLVPKEIQQWGKRGLFDDPELVRLGRESNLLETMFATFETKSAQRMSIQSSDQILHVCYSNGEAYRAAMRGTNGHEEVFWFKCMANMPTPRQSTVRPFFLNHDHPHYTEIKTWARNAERLQQTIDEAFKLFDQLLERVGTPGVLIRVWPAMGSFIKSRHGWPMSNPDTKQIERATYIVEKLFGNGRQRKIESLLATAIMLPDKYQPTAWVGFHSEGMGYET